MAKKRCVVTGGIDTHGRMHHVAVIDGVGRRLGDEQFAASTAGYAAALAWMRGHGELVMVGVEGTASYGAGISRALHGAGVSVVDVMRADRQSRRRVGKSDSEDAYQAARAALSGEARAVAKTQDGPVQAIRTLKVLRDSLITDRTRHWNALHALIVGSPQDLREALSGLTGDRLLAACRDLGYDPGPVADPRSAACYALAELADLIGCLSCRILTLDEQLEPLVATTSPTLLTLPGVGTQTAARLLVTVGDNADRVHSSAALARITGVAPIPVSTNNSRRVRLDRGGDRQANSAVFMIVLSRMAHHQQTRDYVANRTREGLTKPMIIRCLKRYVIRELHTAIQHDHRARHAA